MKLVQDLELQQVAKDLSFISQKIYLLATGDSRIPKTKEYKETLVNMLKKATEELEKISDSE